MASGTQNNDNHIHFLGLWICLSFLVIKTITVLIEPLIVIDDVIIIGIISVVIIVILIKTK